MSEPVEFRFGSCVVMPDKREVLWQGQSRSISPKAFDVLVYLIVHRDRVVRRDELIREIWKGRVVVDNVVSRTIMQTRQAIGDNPENPTLIRTAQRVGYRFVAPLEGSYSAAPKLLPPVAVDKGPAIRLGFLPFVNQTGNPNLAWVELGLFSLVVQSLNSHPHLSVPSTSSVLMCTEGFTPGMSEGEKAHKLMAMLGVKFVISTLISKMGARFSIAFRSFGAEEHDFEKVINGPELTQLGLTMAEEVVQRLLPSTSPGIAPQSNNAFVNECFSRGMQASDARQWDAASKFLAIVCMFEPVTMAARLEYAYVQARIPNRAAVGMARALIDEAVATGDRVSEARATYVLALALAESETEGDLAREQVDQAIRSAPSNMGAEWLIRAHLLKSYLAYMRKDYAACATATEEARRVCEEYGNRVAFLTVLINRAALESELGDIESSYATLREILVLGQEVGSLPLQVYANLSHAAFALGRFEEGLESGDGFFERFETMKDRPFISIRLAIFGLFSRASELHDTERLLRWNSQIGDRLGSADSAVGRMLDLAREAMLEQSCGNLCAASRLFAEADLHMLTSDHYRELSVVMPFSILNFLRLDKVAEAIEQREFLRAFEEYSKDVPLRPAMQYLDALFSWKAGNFPVAVAQMADSLKSSFPGRWQAQMRIDLAWHYLQTGPAEQAEKLLVGLTPWLEHHPAGLAVAALLALRRGELALARSRHAQHVRLAGGDALTRFSELKSFYQKSTNASAIVPNGAEMLPSFYCLDGNVLRLETQRQGKRTL